MIAITAILALLAAQGETEWETVPLDELRIPPVFFFCKGSAGSEGPHTLFIRHNGKDKSVLDVARFADGGESAGFEASFGEAAFREIDDQNVEIKISAESQSDSLEVVLKVADGSQTARFDWTHDMARYSAECQSAPLPPGREN